MNQVVAPRMAVFEDELDALDEAVKLLGGYKKVGVRLRPELEAKPEAASQWLRDCLNRSQPEKLDLKQVMALLRWANEEGFHEPKHWFDGELGYLPTPAITREEKENQLARIIEAAASSLDRATSQLERLRSDRAWEKDRADLALSIDYHMRAGPKV